MPYEMYIEICNSLIHLGFQGMVIAVEAVIVICLVYFVVYVIFRDYAMLLNRLKEIFNE